MAYGGVTILSFHRCSEGREKAAAHSTRNSAHLSRAVSDAEHKLLPVCFLSLQQELYIGKRTVAVWWPTHNTAAECSLGLVVGAVRAGEFFFET